ncbi:hypothetical protein AHMF7616_03018 [Adhaeribacter pallidiroseus]|uniref:Uncharacterized protein n=2 Tax=Adhaeribacter pallidiroseus TaxID=2072847 RepID=A0A369QI56_9BACT|nr:hypothetical protein AHMF7616_03018 [Adhaeribacter pallidiroseus]
MLTLRGVLQQINLVKATGKASYVAFGILIKPILNLVQTGSLLLPIKRDNLESQMLKTMVVPSKMINQLSNSTQEVAIAKIRKITGT